MTKQLVKRAPTRIKGETINLWQTGKSFETVLVNRRTNEVYTKHHKCLDAALKRFSKYAA